MEPRVLDQMVKTIQKVSVALGQVGYGLSDFSGLMNEYARLCQNTVKEGKELRPTLGPQGQPLVAYPHNVRYIGEVFYRIFGNTVLSPFHRQAFLETVGVDTGNPLAGLEGYEPCIEYSDEGHVWSVTFNKLPHIRAHDESYEVAISTAVSMINHLNRRASEEQQ